MIVSKFADTHLRQFVVNVSTAAIHDTDNPAVKERPAYQLSKMTGTLAFQVIAAQSSPKDLQIVSFHPGVIYNEAWEAMGLKDEGFDSGKL